MSSSSAPDCIKVLDGKVVTREKANKDEYKAALEAVKKDDFVTEWGKALLSHYEHTTVTCPSDQKTFQILS